MKLSISLNFLEGFDSLPSQAALIIYNGRVSSDPGDPVEVFPARRSFFVAVLARILRQLYQFIVDRSNSVSTLSRYDKKSNTQDTRKKEVGDDLLSFESNIFCDTDLNLPDLLTSSNRFKCVSFCLSRLLASLVAVLFASDLCASKWLSRTFLVSILVVNSLKYLKRK